MLLRKEIECILRAILYPSTRIVLVCKDEKESEKYINDFRTLINEHKIIQPEIKEVCSDEYIAFQNGSFINLIKRKEVNNEQPIRSQRFNKFFDSIQDLFIINDEEFENIIEPYINDKKE